MKPAKCPFYPDSCTVEFHPNMQHVWRQTKSAELSKVLTDGDAKALYHEVAVKAATNRKATNSERAQAWNKANRKQYNARQKLLMAGKRVKRGG